MNTKKIHFTENNKTLVRGQLADGVYEVWKERGETLAELLKRFRNEKGFPSNKPITYAGRLDPMAEGIVLLLYGNARFEKDMYLRATKTYKVEVLFGVETDSLDPLGVITNYTAKTISHDDIAKTIVAMKTITSLPYPQYSSRPVDGVPLFVHARNGRTVSIPEKKVTINDAQLCSIKTVDFVTYASSAIEDIATVVGDFRQEECIASWKEAIEKKLLERCILATISVTVSSGTYMRSLAKWCGEELGVSAIAYRIVRTSIHNTF
jgi:tRNA pseudouridine55 synthase